LKYQGNIGVKYIPWEKNNSFCLFGRRIVVEYEMIVMTTTPELMDAEEKAVRLVYQHLLQAWNNMNAKEYAGLFAKDANLIGFDGSLANGREEILSHLSSVFENHKTGKYVSLVKEVRFLDSGIAILRAVAGMVPAGQKDINPAINAIQTAVLHKQGDKYRIVLFQNTPAAFHGRPEEAEKLTAELHKVLELAVDA
jgi:uncharacterized protein (TIGR02246 family)